MRIAEFLKSAYRIVWADNPWFVAAGFIVGPIAGFLLIAAQLPSEFRYMPDPQYFHLIYLVIGMVYLLIVSALLANKLRMEKEFRRRESSFRYDNRGTLFYNSEPNIAFNINTFKSIMTGLSAKFGGPQLQEALISIGAESSDYFATIFVKSYDRDVARGLHSNMWVSLNFTQKLEQWAEYESQGGWGIFSASETRTGISVSVTHLKGLMEGEGGELFGYFLGGYCQRLLSEVVRSQAAESSPGKYADYSGVELLEVTSRNADTIELSYSWR